MLNILTKSTYNPLYDFSDSFELALKKQLHDERSDAPTTVPAVIETLTKRDPTYQRLATRLAQGVAPDDVLGFRRAVQLAVSDQQTSMEDELLLRRMMGDLYFITFPSLKQSFQEFASGKFHYRPDVDDPAIHESFIEASAQMLHQVDLPPKHN